MNTKHVFLLIVVVLFILGGVYWYVSRNSDDRGADTVDTSSWQTYTNERFGFSLKYPPNWKVHEAPDNPEAPKFNFYKPGIDEDKLPYTHHTQNVTHVSVFPQGIPTEGVMGESRRSSVDFSIPTREPRDFLLSNGSVWATFAGIPPTTGAWNESGFIFAQTPITNHETDCLRDGKIIPPEQCDPLTGDQIIHHGTVDKNDRLIQEAILSTFTLVGEQSGNEYKDILRVHAPLANEEVASPLTVRGEARGQWYFEATFPVRIIDANGNILGEHFATAEGEWMTEAFVPFTVELSFQRPETRTGTLILEKSNPSGLPEHADEFRIPVRFDTDTLPQRTVKLYYYNSEKDTDDNGNIMCSEQGLVAVERTIPATQTPIQDAVRTLLKGELTPQERNQGITTEYPLKGLKLTGASLSNGILTLSFDDPNSATSGGSCRAGILWLQIRETALQFDAVDEVRFQPEELFQP